MRGTAGTNPPIALNADFDLNVQRFAASGRLPTTNHFVNALLGLAYRDPRRA